MTALNRRVLALEASRLGKGRGFVLTYALGESPDDALRRAPGPGGYLVVGEGLPPEVWCQLAQAQQHLLLTGAWGSSVVVAHDRQPRAPEVGRPHITGPILDR